ncbi:MAG: hypothetical protein JJE50_11495 [Actinomycetales bacterium]|nr:hypothetical protein [Actinomycetales bacterium]
MSTDRPVVHSAPTPNWANDPNGLVFDGERHHLFFQDNPYSDQWGNMSWGHASSPDPLAWTEHEVALLRTDTEDAFSGSVVLDAGNTSGLGAVGESPLVALYTSAALPSAPNAGEHAADQGLLSRPSWSRPGR